MNNSLFAKIAIWAVIALVLFTVFKQLERGSGGSVRTIAYSDFIDQVHAGHIKNARLQDSSGGGLDITATNDEGSQIHTTGTVYDRGLFKDLFDNKVQVELEPHEQPSPLLSFFYAFGPVILLIGVWIFFMRQMQGGGRGGAFSFG
ncbi:MAG TPA: ATP-dependent metallopeptidase FtsH/Yme1/Tma family protein, partial [Burkholderiaceae bacterium]